MLDKDLPFIFFTLKQVITNQIDGFLNFLNSTISVAFLWTSRCSQNMWNLLLTGILEEIPNHRWSHRIKLLSLYRIIGGLLEVFIGPLLFQFLLVLDPFFLVFINHLLNFVFFHRLETFQKNVVLNIFNNLIIDVFEVFCSCKPFGLILFIEVTFPYPVPSVFFPLSLLKTLLHLILAQIE